MSDRDGRTTWRPLLGSLTDWAAANGVEHYFIRWRERRHARHETFGLLVLERILTPEVTAWLVDADPEILQGLLSAVAGIDDGAVLGRLVTEADRASVERDLRENHIDPAATALGVPVDRYLLDAMRRLARGGRWQINVPGARLWMLAEGLHLVWPAGAEDVVALLAADRVPGIPRDPDTLADILLERGLAIPRQEGNHAQRYWRLAPEPLARDGQVVTLSMLRLASPDLVLAGAPPAPVGLALASEPVTLETASEPPAEPSADETSEEAVRTVEEGTSPAAAMRPSRQSVSAAHARAEQPAISPAGQGTDPDDHPGQAASKAAAWLRARGAGGETLLALAEVLSADPRAWDQRIRRNGEQLVVLFPDGLAGLGASPQAHLDALASAGLLDLNPLTPLRRVTEIDGQHGALLTLDASRRVLALIADRSVSGHRRRAHPRQGTWSRRCQPPSPADAREPPPADPAPPACSSNGSGPATPPCPVACRRPTGGCASDPRPCAPGRRRRACRSTC